MYFLSLLTRCKDEPYISEFVEYYLNEGVEHIYIIDDDSQVKYDSVLLNNPKVTIYFEKNIITRDVASQVYSQIRNCTEWLIYMDVDEYIVTKKNPDLSIAQELKQSFHEVDCIKIPWVMMSANGREKNPKSLLKETLYRWDHDKKHPNVTSNVRKFRCRYEAIEIKSIFRPDRFDQIWDHHPKKPVGVVHCVDSIDKKEAPLDPFYSNLREEDISQAYFVCYHYRILSIENSLSKIKNNIWYKKFTIDDLLSSDYAEIMDETVKNRVIQYHEN
jgi:hypothetical protein